MLNIKREVEVAFKTVESLTHTLSSRYYLTRLQWNKLLQGREKLSTSQSLLRQKITIKAIELTAMNLSVLKTAARNYEAASRSMDI